MKQTLYAIQDVLVGFNAPIIAANDEAMSRDYKIWAGKAPNGSDMRLFKVGEYDTETGEITPIVPQCMIGGITNENNI